MPLPVIAGAAAASLIGAGIKAGAGAIKGGIGMYQRMKAKRALENMERPVYEIPEEIKANLTQSQMMSIEGLPAEQKKQYVENLQRATEAGIGFLGQGGDRTRGASDLMQQQIEGYRNLLGMDEQAKINNVQSYMDHRDTMAGFKDTQYNINEMEPYREERQGYINQMHTGQHNQFVGLDQMAAAGGNYSQNLLELQRANLGKK